MDAAKILGGLLGNRSSGGGLGADILGKVLSGALSGGSQSRQPTQTAQRPKAPAARNSQSPLGNLLREAMRRGGVSLPQSHQPTQAAGYAPAPPTPQHQPPQECADDDLNAQSVVLIRAMINAAKSDGQIDSNEQQTILQKLGQLSPEEVQFLKQEFAAPLDVDAFADSVPLGMEEQVYALSVMAIRLDQNAEARYLQDLAKDLRLAPEYCNQVHQQLGAPPIFR